MVECREEDGIALIFFGVRIDIRSIVRVIMMRVRIRTWDGVLRSIGAIRKRKLGFKLRGRSWGRRNR